MQNAVRYSQAIRRKYPESVTIALAKDSRGIVNPIALGWWMCTSHEPPMLAISVGLKRYSLQVIREAQNFVLAIPSESMARETLLYGTISGRDEDKLKLAGAQTQRATSIDNLLLTDAAANFECTVTSEHVTGDHVIFVGKVLQAHENTESDLNHLCIVGPGHQLGGVRPYGAAIDPGDLRSSE